MAANIPTWTVQPPKGMLKGDYYRIEERFPPYYPGVEGQFPADPGHLGIIEVIKTAITWTSSSSTRSPLPPITATCTAASPSAAAATASGSTPSPVCRWPVSH